MKDFSKEKNNSEIIGQEKDMKETPSWDLRDLYNGIDDPKIESVLKEQLERAEKFDKKYRGKINNFSFNPESLLTAIEEYELIHQELIKPISYADLVFAADSKNQKHGAFLQKMETRQIEITQKLLFFELELTNLGETVLKNLADNPILKNYEHYLNIILIWKSHRLSEMEEKLLEDKNLTGKSAFIRLFNEEMASKKYILEAENGVRQLSQADILKLLYNPDRSLRKKAAESFTKGLEENLRRVSYIFNTLIEDKIVNDRYMKFTTPEESRHLSNEINQEIADVLNETVANNYKIVQDFYDFKKKVLNLDILYDYDRYAPIDQSTKEVTFGGARNIILGSFKKFSPQFFNIAEEFFEKHWIDAANRDGKEGGASCISISPDSHPFILINYRGNIEDVRILAHEIGHGIHGYLSREQTHLNYDRALTLEETTSIFSEMLICDQLGDFLPDKKEKFSLYISTIESIFATLFRQISMYRFEKHLYSSRREKGELAPEEIGAMWRKSQKEMFGNSVELTENYDKWWSYIPHFISDPFYVYAYAFGQLLTLSLYAKYRKGESGFIDKYRSLLKAGQSKSPQELLAPLGINLEDKSFWQDGINIIKDMIEKAKKLYMEIKLE